MNQLMRHNRAEAELNAYLSAPDGGKQKSKPAQPDVEPNSGYVESAAQKILAEIQTREKVPGEKTEYAVGIMRGLEIAYDILMGNMLEF